MDNQYIAIVKSYQQSIEHMWIVVFIGVMAGLMAGVIFGRVTAPGAEELFTRMTKAEQTDFVIAMSSHYTKKEVAKEWCSTNGETRKICTTYVPTVRKGSQNE